MPITHEALLEKFGFAAARDPFKSVNAAEERLFLPEYFVAPPFFESVWGNPLAAKSCVVFAPTGAGKTAQVIMIQERASQQQNQDNAVLTLLYDDFEKQGIIDVSQAGLSSHLHALTRIATIALLEAIGRYCSNSMSFSPAEREEIQYLASNYLGGATEESLVAALRNTRSPLKKLADSATSVAVSIPFVAAAMKLLHMEPASATILGLQAAIRQINPTKEAALKSDPDDRREWYDFERVLRLLRSYYSATYILVDRVDETSYTTRNAEQAFKLISPLVTSLPLLNPQDSAWCFKFFLWEAVESYYLTQGRTDRVETHKLEWSDDQICMMLDRRFAYYSAQTLTKFADLFPLEEFEDLKIDVRKIITVFSGGSPRDSIRMLQRIFNSYLEALNSTGEKIENVAPKIPSGALWSGVNSFAKERFKELVPDAEMRRQMESIHRVSFTSTTLTTSVQKITVNAANSKISSWRQRGAIVQIGDVMMNRTGKPNRLFTFSDPRSSICVSGLGAQQFISSKMGQCSHCGAIQIRDWEHGNQLGQCSKCQAALSQEEKTVFSPDAMLLRKARREISSVFEDCAFIEMIAADFNLSTGATSSHSAEPMWKDVISQACNVGPDCLQRVLEDLIDRAPSHVKFQSTIQLLKLAQQERS